MSRGIMIYSTEDIPWNAFHDFLLTALKKIGVEECRVAPEHKWARFQKKEPSIEYDFTLIQKTDWAAFLIDQEADEVRLPLQWAVAISIYSPTGLAHAYRPTLEVLCGIAEKWPIIVDTDKAGEEPDVYTNEELFQRLREGRDIFP